MTTMTRETFVSRPSTTPLRSTILDHATVSDLSSFSLRNNEGLWVSYNCIETGHDVTLCEPSGSKTFLTAPWMPAFEFAAYAGAKCSAVGLDMADMRSEVQRVFSVNEGKIIERAVLSTRLVDGEDWDAPVNLSANGMTLAAALAALEGYAAAVYAGVPTIHMPRAALSLLGGSIEWDGDKAFTKSGSKVVAGGGYDTTAVPTGTYTLYATGEVYVERSETIDVQTFTLPGDGSAARGHTDNTVLTLAERMYRVGVDCFTATATGKAY